MTPNTKISILIRTNSFRPASDQRRLGFEPPELCRWGGGEILMRARGVNDRQPCHQNDDEADQGGNRHRFVLFVAILVPTPSASECW